jgi:putative hemolysin
MMNKLMLAAALLAPMAVMAADAPAPASNVPASAAQVRAQARNSVSLQCQQQAAEQKLEGQAKKEFLVKCVNPDGKAAPAPAK